MPLGLVFSPRGLALGLAFFPRILTQPQATSDSFYQTRGTPYNIWDSHFLQIKPLYSILQRIWLSNLLFFNGRLIKTRWFSETETFFLTKCRGTTRLWTHITDCFIRFLGHVVPWWFADGGVTSWFCGVTCWGTALEDLRSSHANLSTRKSSLDSHHANLKDCRSEEFFDVFCQTLQSHRRIEV